VFCKLYNAGCGMLFWKARKMEFRLCHTLLQDMKYICTFKTLPSRALVSESLATSCKHRQKLRIKFRSTISFYYERTTWLEITHSYGMRGLFSVFWTSHLLYLLRAKTVQSTNPQKYSIKLPVNPSIYGCLPSSLLSSGLQSTFQKEYGNHKVTQSRK
jgi:hypothetical protein